MLEGLKPLYNSVLRPFARFLMRFGIHPNHITIFGLILFMTAGYLSGIGRWYSALIFVILGATMDGLDGVLARESGKKSVFGAILDSSCDRLTEIFLLLGILAYYIKGGLTNTWGIYLCFTGISGSVMVSYIKARCEGAGVSCSRGLMQRPERIILLSAGLLAGSGPMLWFLLALTIFASVTVVQRLFEAAAQCKETESNVLKS
jgi:CDP-diacylglycerol--glycerol-3-phosphate 3-phosphatidyltransferase